MALYMDKFFIKVIDFSAQKLKVISFEECCNFCVYAKGIVIKLRCIM
jgi:hypothetical protein